jgi:hypothetical protein
MVLWKLIAAARIEVENRTCPSTPAVWPRWAAAIVNTTSGPWSWAACTMWSGPAATVIAHADTPYNTAIIVTAR